MGIFMFWIVCGLIGLGITAYNVFVVDKADIVTVGDVTMLTVMFVLGPITLVAGGLMFAYEWLNDNGDKVVWRRK